MNVVGKAGREDDESRKKGHERIEGRNAYGFSGEGEIISHIGAEYFQCRNAERQSEKCLVHGCGSHIAKTGLYRTVPVRQEVEFKARTAAFQEYAVYGKDHDEEEKAAHHPFRNPFYSVMKPKAADGKAHKDGNGHENTHFPGTAQHGSEYFWNGFLGNSGKRAGQEFPEISQHPAGNSRIVHHEKVAAQDAEPPVDVPLRTGRLQRFIAEHCGFPGCAAHRQLHGHDRYAHEEKKSQIKENEHGSSVFAGNVREFPYIPDPDGAACAHQQKSQTGLETVTIVHITSSKYNDTSYFILILRNFPL